MADPVATGPGASSLSVVGDAPEAIDLSEGLWDVDDVAAFLKCSRRSVYALPGLPFVKLRITGRRWLKRYAPSQVRAWARARLTHAITPAAAPPARAA